MLSASACWVKVQLSSPKCYWLFQGWRAALFTPMAILSLPMRSPEWMAGVQKLVTKCGQRLRVLALEMQVSMIDVAAVVQHIAQQYVGVGRFIAAALPRLTHGAVAHQLRPAVAGALAGRNGRQRNGAARATLPQPGDRQLHDRHTMRIRTRLHIWMIHTVTHTVARALCGVG